MPKRILVADDESDTREIVKLLLQKEDYEVVCVPNGKSCMEKLEDGKIDLLILDVMMPRMDGWKVATKMKENEKMKKIPIIMLTVKGLEEDRARAEKLGVDDYIVKPFDIDNLIQRVKRKFNA